MASNGKVKTKVKPPSKAAVRVAPDLPNAAKAAKAAKAPRKTKAPTVASPPRPDPSAAPVVRAKRPRRSPPAEPIIEAEVAVVADAAAPIEVDEASAFQPTCIGNPFASLVDPAGHHERVAQAASLARIKGLQYKPVEFPLLDRPRRLFDVFDPETGDMVRAPGSPDEGPVAPLA